MIVWTFVADNSSGTGSNRLALQGDEEESAFLIAVDPRLPSPPDKCRSP